MEIIRGRKLNVQYNGFKTSNFSGIVYNTKPNITLEYIRFFLV